MDPVKEKINLLKKLAQEKKNAPTAVSEQDDDQLSDQQPDTTQEKTVESAASSSNETKSERRNSARETPVIDNKEQTSSSKMPSEPYVSKLETLKERFEANKQKRENSIDESTKMANENKENKAEPKLRSNSNSLDLTEETDSVASSSVKFANNVKQPYKSFTVAQQSDPSTSKYINKIRDLYDRERASSSDSINQPSRPYYPSHHQRKFYPNSAGYSQYQAHGVSPLAQNRSSQKRESESSDDTTLTANVDRLKNMAAYRNEMNSIDEDNTTMIDDTDVSSIFSKPGTAAASKKTKKNLDQLVDSFNQNSGAFKFRTDSIESLKRNSVPTILDGQNSSQIEKLKEKFNNLNTVNPNPNAPKSHNSTVIPPLQSASFSNFSNNPLAVPGDPNDASQQGRLDVDENNDEDTYKNEKSDYDNDSSKKMPSPRQIHKYQKSITSDLADLLRANDENEPRYSSISGRNDFDMDRCYQPENAIIQSTLSVSPARNIGRNSTTQATYDNNSEKPSQINRPQDAAYYDNLKKKLPLITLNNNETLSGRNFNRNPSTKSILKSPSAVSEKSIHFDDFVNVIQINNSPSSNFSASQSPSPSPPPSRASQPNTVSNSYLMPNQPNARQSPNKPVFKNEIDSIKKMLLEPKRSPFNDYSYYYHKSRGTSRSPQPPARATSLKYSNERSPMNRYSERVFVKSPTPMRELPSSIMSKQMPPPIFDDDYGMNNSRNEAVNENENKNRNRFLKKKASLRSQSLELSRIVPPVMPGQRDNEVNHVIYERLPSPVRPNLKRQNAFTKNFTKSLGDDLNRISAYDEYNDRDRDHRHHHHHHHHHRHHRGHSHRHRQVHHRHSHNQRRSHPSQILGANNSKAMAHYRSSSLTSSSASDSQITTTTTTSSESLADLPNERSVSLIVEDYSTHTANDDYYPNIINENMTLNDPNKLSSTNNAGSNLIKLKKKNPITNMIDRVKTSFNNLSLFNASKSQDGKKKTVSGDLSSDDSICGIPKSSKVKKQPNMKKPNQARLCTSNKTFHKSMDELGYRANYEEYPSFDDQGSHLSRNPSASANTGNNNNGTISSLNNSTGLISSNSNNHQTDNNNGLMVKNPIANPALNYNNGNTTGSGHNNNNISQTILGLSGDYNEHPQQHQLLVNNLSFNNNDFQQKQKLNMSPSQTRHQSRIIQPITNPMMSTGVGMATPKQQIKVRNLSHPYGLDGHTIEPISSFLHDDNALESNKMSNEYDVSPASYYSNLNNNNAESNYGMSKRTNSQRKMLPTYSQLSIPNSVSSNSNFVNYQQPQPAPNSQNSLNYSNFKTPQGPGFPPYQPQQHASGKNSNDYLKYDNNWSIGSPIIPGTTQIQQRRVPSPSPTRNNANQANYYPVESFPPAVKTSSSQYIPPNKSSAAANTPATNNFNLYSLIDPLNKRITQPYQQQLLNLVTSPEPTGERNQHQASSNRYQHLKSKSLDATGASSLLGSGATDDNSYYNNNMDNTSYNNLDDGSHDYSREDNYHQNQVDYMSNSFINNNTSTKNSSELQDSGSGGYNTNLYDQQQLSSNTKTDLTATMPQSVAIQEKLKRFEDPNSFKSKPGSDYYVQQQQQQQPGLYKSSGQQQTSTSGSDRSKLMLARKKSPFSQQFDPSNSVNNKENSPIYQQQTSANQYHQIQSQSSAPNANSHNFSKRPNNLISSTSLENNDNSIMNYNNMSMNHMSNYGSQPGQFINQQRMPQQQQQQAQQMKGKSFDSLQTGNPSGPIAVGNSNASIIMAPMAKQSSPFMTSNMRPAPNNSYSLESSNLNDHFGSKVTPSQSANPALSGYKYSQFAVPPNSLNTQNTAVNMIKSLKFEKSPQPQNNTSTTSYFPNPNSLAAATAAAAAAVAAQQQQLQQQTFSNLFDESSMHANVNANGRSKGVKNDYAPNNKSNYQSLNDSSLMAGGPMGHHHQYQQSPQRFENMDNQYKNAINPLGFQQQNNTPMTGASKRTAIYENKSYTDEPFRQQSPQSGEHRRNSINKMSISPLKYTSQSQNPPSGVNVAGKNYNNNNNMSHNSIEDVEVLSSSSASSASSYKENHRFEKPGHHHHHHHHHREIMSSNSIRTGMNKSNPNLLVQGGQNETELGHNSGDSASSTSSASAVSGVGGGSKEPSKLSMSEKLKLFSAPTSSGHNQSLTNDSSSSSNQLKLSRHAKRNPARFQTQPISLSELEYANELSKASILNINGNTGSGANKSTIEGINLEASTSESVKASKKPFENNNNNNQRENCLEKDLTFDDFFSQNFGSGLKQPVLNNSSRYKPIKQHQKGSESNRSFDLDWNNSRVHKASKAYLLPPPTHLPLSTAAIRNNILADDRMISISPNQYSPSSSSSTSSSSSSSPSSMISSSSNSLPIKAAIEAFNEYSSQNGSNKLEKNNINVGPYKNVKQLSMSAQSAPPPPPLANGGANSQTYKMLSQSNSSVHPSLKSRNNGVFNASASSFSIENNDVPTLKSSPFQRNNSNYASQQSAASVQSSSQKSTTPTSVMPSQLKASHGVHSSPQSALNKSLNTISNSSIGLSPTNINGANRFGVNSSYSLLSHNNPLKRDAKTANVTTSSNGSPKPANEISGKYSPVIISVISKNPPPPPVITAPTTASTSSSASPTSSSSSNASPTTQSVRNNIFMAKNNAMVASSSNQSPNTPTQSSGPVKANSSKSFSLLSGFQRSIRSNQSNTTTPTNQTPTEKSSEATNLERSTTPSFQNRLNGKLIADSAEQFENGITRSTALGKKPTDLHPANNSNSGIVLSAINRSFNSETSKINSFAKTSKPSTNIIQQSAVNENSKVASSLINANQMSAVNKASTPPPATTMTSMTNENADAAASQLASSRNELKRYKVKSKTDFILSASTNALPNAAETRKTNASSGSENDNEVSSTLGVGMSIQERLAALKKSGEEEWKKRSAVSTGADEAEPTQSYKPAGSVSGLVKQQQEQLKQQLQSGLNKNLSQQSKLNSHSDAKRAILAPLSDNKPSNEDQYIDSIQEESKAEKRAALINKRIMFNPFQPQQHSTQQTVSSHADEVDTIDNSQKPSRPKPQAKMVRMHSAGSDTDTIFARNASKISNMLANSQKKPKSAGTSGTKRATPNESTIERVELFSTDSEMDSFFKENESIVNKSNPNNYLMMSSSGGSSPNKNTDENTMNEDMDDDIEFDRIVSEAQRLTQGTRAKPSRKTKSKGNHLKNLKNRIEIKNEYEQSVQSAAPAEPAGGKKIDKNTPMLARQINTNASKLTHVNSKDSGFTEAAIAGLAAKEDFSCIKLKRSNSTNKSAGLYAPYKDLMLMQIKGRRYCQTRLVEPAIDSLNNNDCFILIHNNHLFLWIGEYANVIEKAKANEIYDWIRFKKDLGLNKSQSSFSVIDNKTSPILDTLDDILKNSFDIPPCSTESDEDYDDDSYYDQLASKYQDSAVNKLTNQARTVQDFLLPLGLNRKNLKQLIKFFKQNDNSENVDDAMSIDNNDEKYESLMNETNMVYKVSLNAGDSEFSSSNNDTDECENEDETLLDADGEADEAKLSQRMKRFCLEPVKPYWGQLLSYNMLDEEEVFVFDFGGELYIWNGRNANNLKKKVAIVLTKQLFESGYDYSNLSISPIKPLISLFNRYKSSGEEPDFIKSLKSRPKWTILGKQSQNCETILFIEKFIDWPNQSNNPSLKKLAYNGAIMSSSQNSFESVSTPASTPGVKKANVFFNSSSRQASVTTPTNTTPSVSSPFAPKADSFFKFEALTSEQIATKFFKSDYRNTESDEVNLVLENSNLGRGRHWFDAIERRSYDIVTENVHVWRIQENQLVECAKNSFGELLDTNTYVIKWHYKINAVGFKTLKGEASTHQGITGRDRYALFFWQGELSSLNEKATSALLSLDLGNNASLSSASPTSGSSLTTEDGETIITAPTNLLFDKRSIPHVHLCQYKEIAAFCQLFDGSLIVLAAHHANPEWRMFELRGELEEESHLIEIAKPSDECLRSRTSFIFVNVAQRVFVIWHGSYSSDFHRSLIRTCATKLSNRNSKHFAFGHCDDLEINEIDEGTDEEASFLYELFQTRTRAYHSLENLRYELNLSKDSVMKFQSHSPRLFLMTSLYGQFELNEVLNPMRTKEAVCPYPFYQFHLYEEKQPALFMLDNFNEIYIWQGWFESMSDVKPYQQQSVILQNELDATNGTAKIRYTINRKCAFQTAINYWQEKYPDKDFRGFVVYAGLEPKEFTSLFPIWRVNENARNCNLNDGKTFDQMDSIQEILKQLNRDCYPLEVLRQRPLPDGVNPLKLECYLSDKEFEDLLKMSKEAFFAQPAWKQTNMKKKANLF